MIVQDIVSISLLEFLVKKSSSICLLFVWGLEASNDRRTLTLVVQFCEVLSSILEQTASPGSPGFSMLQKIEGPGFLCFYLF